MKINDVLARMSKDLNEEVEFGPRIEGDLLELERTGKITVEGLDYEAARAVVVAEIERLLQGGRNT